jgi:DNA-binding beta-propeller fold protein YncE
MASPTTSLGLATPSRAGSALTRLRDFGGATVDMLAPNAVAVDPQGNVYVGEGAGRDRLLVFDPSGKLLRTWGGKAGSGEREFNYITGVALDLAGNVYVTDFNNQRVQKFDNQGHVLLAFPTEPPVGPASLAVDRQGNIYVSNHRQHAHTVQKFDPAGHLLRAWGPPGSGDGQFAANAAGGPDQLALDTQGNVYVTDPNNHRVQKFDADGTFRGAFGTEGSEMGQFTNGPYGLAVDRQGNIYASDLSGTIQKFDAGFKPLASWRDTGASRVIAVDDVGDLYVKDDAAAAVHKYRQPCAEERSC